MDFEAQIVKGLIERMHENLIKNELKEEAYSYLHPTFGKLVYKFVIDNRTKRGHENEYILNFIIAKDESTYCSSWLSAGSLNDIMDYLVRIRSDIHAVANNIPDYYRHLFEEMNCFNNRVT